LFACWTGFTVTVVVPDFVVSCVDVAVIVTGVLVDTTWAVNRPELLLFNDAGDAE